MNEDNVRVDPSIFKAYDVRGIYGQNLTEPVAYRIGRAAAQYLNVPEIAVGRDMRTSSPQLADSLLHGIVDQGVNGLLQHALLIAHDDLRRTQLEEPLEAVVAVDHPAVQVVEITGREAAAVELHHWAQLRWDYR